MELRNLKIKYQEDLLKANKTQLLTIAIHEQESCPHTTVHQYEGVSPPAIRICPACGLEEWASNWSGISTEYWTRRDYQPGKLDNKDGRRVRQVSGNEFFKFRIEGQPIPKY